MSDSNNDSRMTATLMINMSLCVVDLVLVILVLYFELGQQSWLPILTKIMFALSLLIASISYAIQKHHLVRDPLRVILAIEALLLAISFPML